MNTPALGAYNFVFYANASAQIGAGHVMRLLALAEACQAINNEHCKEQSRKITLTFVAHTCPQVLQDKLGRHGFTCTFIPEHFSCEDFQDFSADVIFVDDYFLSQQQQQVFKDSSAFIVKLDDNYSDEHTESLLIGDLIVNAASNANKTPIKNNYLQANPNAIYCLGLQYALLRQEFSQKSIAPLASRQQIFVSLGASDVKNMLCPLISELIKYFQQSLTVDICVLVGGLNEQALSYLQYLATLHPQLKVYSHSDQVAQLMLQSGLAISAAGGTLNELASAGTPALALVSVENQKAALQSESDDLWFESIDIRDFPRLQYNTENNIDFKQALPIPAMQTIEKICRQSHKIWNDLCKRESMSKIARQNIDGLGSRRVIEKLLTALQKA